jgi:hypothetical protein
MSAIKDELKALSSIPVFTSVMYVQASASTPIMYEQTSSSAQVIYAPEYEKLQVKNDRKKKMADELEEYYLNLDKTLEVNKQIKDMIDEILEKDNYGPPSERGYASFKGLIIDKINKIL